MNVILKSGLFLASLLVSTGAFSQGLEGPGGPGGGNSVAVSVQVVEGMDDLTTYRRDSLNNVIAEHWTRDWTESDWRLNGEIVYYSAGGIGVSFTLSPSIPAENSDGINTPIEMTSEGTLKVVVQYSGDPQNMPSEVGVIVQSTAFAAYKPSGSGEADNGLGDDSFYVAPGGNYSVLGLAGQHSTGKNLRIIPLNSSGYGELEFSPSAYAQSSSSNGPSMWASAQSATATLDPRTIWVRRLGDPHTFYEPDNDAATVETFNYTPTISGAKFATINYSYENIPKKAVVPEYNAFATSTMSVTKGLSPKHGVPQSTQFTYHGHSTFLYSQPGHGTFFWEVDNLVAPNQLSGTCTNQYDHDQYVNADVGHPFYLSSPMFHAGQFHDVTNGYEKYDEDETHSAKYNVNWGDGVKGSAELVTTWMPKAFYIDQSEVFPFGYTDVISGELPKEELELIGDYPDGWIPKTQQLASATTNSWPEIIRLASGASGVVKAGEYVSRPLQLTGLMKESVISGMLSGADYLLSPLAQSQQYGVSKSDHPIGIFENGIEISSGHRYFDYPSDYSWRPFCIPSRYLRLGTIMMHADDGYSGSTVTTSLWQESHKDAPKGIRIKRVIPSGI